MTGIGVRVERHGRWQDVDVDELTDEEFRSYSQEQLLRGVSGWTLAGQLLAWIRTTLETPKLPNGSWRVP